MLRSSFVHIGGIGPKTEQRLWESGIETWDSFTDDGPVRFSTERRAAIHKTLEESQSHLMNGVPGFFEQGLPSSQHWRLFPDFRASTAYLDIETTGMTYSANPITTIALYDGTSVKTYVQGRNLDRFIDDIGRYKVLITYNGKCFDVPFLERYFNEPLDQVHIDLRFVLASLGIKGGLKGCEKQMGIDRGPLSDVDGLFAVVLWKEFIRSGNPMALETLLAYNVEDTLNLEYLMVKAYNLKLRETPFYDRYALPIPPLAGYKNPYQVDVGLVEKLKPEHAFLSSLEPRY